MTPFNRIVVAVFLVHAGFTGVACAQGQLFKHMQRTPTGEEQHQNKDDDKGQLFKHMQRAPDIKQPAQEDSASVARESERQEQASRLGRGIRTPRAEDLARMPIAINPSARPSTFEEQEKSRMQEWYALEERRVEQERQQQLALQAERAKPQVIMVQQQDPMLSGLLAIPKALGMIFGSGLLR